MWLRHSRGVIAGSESRGRDHIVWILRGPLSRALQGSRVTPSPALPSLGVVALSARGAGYEAARSAEEMDEACPARAQLAAPLNRDGPRFLWVFWLKAPVWFRTHLRAYGMQIRF